MTASSTSGRTLLGTDNEDQALDVAVVDVKLARRLFGDGNPLGAQILVDHFNEQTFSLERLPVTIVGVVENVRSASLAAESRETIYVPYVFQAFLPLTFVVRTAMAPAMAPTRFLLALSATFAGLALVLATIGLYGVISYSAGSAPGRSACGWPWAPATATWSA